LTEEPSLPLTPGRPTKASIARDGEVAAAQSEAAITERYVNEQIESRRQAVKEQQERMASAQSGQAGLAGRKVSLTEEKSRLATGERPELASEYRRQENGIRREAQGR
jgi:hypothetical protein